MSDDDAKRISVPAGSDDFDYSTPEAQEAMAGVTGLVLEIRDEHAARLGRKIAIYERSLGLAVIPMLLRRWVLTLTRKPGGTGPSR